MNEKLSATELLELMRLGEYSINIVGDELEVSRAFSIDEEMAKYIRMHKAEIISILRSSD